MEELKLAFKDHRTSFELVKGEGGTLEIECNDEIVFDKLQEGRWPAYREVPTLVGQKILNLP